VNVKIPLFLSVAQKPVGTYMQFSCSGKYGYIFPKSKSGKTTVVIPLMFFEKYVYFE